MKRFKMGYYNGSHAEKSGGGGTPGKDGRDGVGFKLTANGNFDIQSKKLKNVSAGSNASDAVVKSQLDEKVSKTMTSHLNANFHVIENLSRGEDDDAFPLFHGKQIFLTTDGTKFDAKNQQIFNLNTDLGNAGCAVNVSSLKSEMSSPSQDIDLNDDYNIVNSKQRTWSGMVSQPDSLVSFTEVLENFLPRKKEFPMDVQLNMNNNSITNLKTPAYGHEAATKSYVDLWKFDGDMNGKKIENVGNPTENSDATTKGFVASELNNAISNVLPLSGGTMSGNIDMGRNQIVNLSEPTADSQAATMKFVEEGRFHPSGGLHNPFLNWMEDDLESSSESGVQVEGIQDFSDTPHKIWKTAYKLQITKGAGNEFVCRIGFNMNPIPKGQYTLVVEFFPPETQNVTVNCVSATVDVQKNILKAFTGAWKATGYWKDLVQMTKSVVTTPDYLMVDLHCQGDSSSPSQGLGWLIVYGVEGIRGNVPSDVLDRPSIIDSGEEIMQVKLNMNQKEIFNVPIPKQNDDAANKQYVDLAGINSILNLATATYVDGYIKEWAECLYLVERELRTEVEFVVASRHVTTLKDHTLSGVDADQTVTSLKPTLSTGKNAKRYFIKFDGSERMVSKLNLNNDQVHIFILFRILTHSGSNQWFRNGLFGHDNGGWDKFVAFEANTNKLIVSGAEKDGTEFNNGFNITLGTNDWETKANASELNKWCLLSVHWDVGEGSSVWVNTKKLKTFAAKSRTGSDTMTFGDLDPNGIAGLNGDIQLFLVYKGFAMDERIIRAHHKMICERFGVDHEKYMF